MLEVEAPYFANRLFLQGLVVKRFAFRHCSDTLGIPFGI